jgi:AraC family transcriptional regulator
MDAQTVERGEMLLVGMSQRVTMAEAPARIPAQWSAFSHYFDKLANRLGRDAFGVVTNADADGSMDYMCCMEVSSFDGCPEELQRMTVAPARYAEFPHDGPVWEIRQAWQHALGECSGKIADAPMMERYQPTYNPNTGTGGMSLLIPLR